MANINDPPVCAWLHVATPTSSSNIATATPNVPEPINTSIASFGKNSRGIRTLMDLVDEKHIGECTCIDMSGVINFNELKLTALGTRDGEQEVVVRSVIGHDEYPAALLTAIRASVRKTDGHPRIVFLCCETGCHAASVVSSAVVAALNNVFQTRGDGSEVQVYNARHYPLQKRSPIGIGKAVNNMLEFVGQYDPQTVRRRSVPTPPTDM